MGKNDREAQIETFVAFLKHQRKGGQAIEEYILEWLLYLYIEFYCNIEQFDINIAFGKISSSQ